MMSIVLLNQIKASAESAVTIGNALRQGPDAQLTAEVDSLVSAGIANFLDLTRQVQAWKSAGGPAAGIPAEQWMTIYTSLAGAFQDIAGVIRASDTAGVKVIGRSDFKNAWRELRAIVGVPLAKLEKAVAEARAGELVDLEDVLDDLQNPADENRAA